MAEHVLHCPNPTCPFRDAHHRPAEYRAGTARCADCGSDLATGKGSFEHRELETAEPLGVICEALEPHARALGPPQGEPIELRRAPGSTSLPVIELLTGAALVIGGLWMVLDDDYGGGVLVALGLAIGTWAVNGLRRRPPIRKVIQPHRDGFTYQVEERAIAIRLADIELAELGQDRLRLKRVTMGVFHTLSLSLDGHVYALSSFEPANSGGNDPFLRWARSLVASVSQAKRTA